MPEETNTMGCIDMIGLTYGEHLVVWGIRRIVTERGPDWLLFDECCCAFGEDEGGGAVKILCLFTCVLGRSARKILEVAAPGTLAMTCDERRILTLVAAAQICTQDNDRTLFDAHLRWLASPVHRPALAQAVRTLGALLAAHGHWFSLPAAAAPPPRSLRDVYAGREPAHCRPII